MRLGNGRRGLRRMLFYLTTILLAPVMCGAGIRSFMRRKLRCIARTRRRLGAQCRVPLLGRLIEGLALALSVSRGNRAVTVAEHAGLIKPIAALMRSVELGSSRAEMHLRLAANSPVLCSKRH
jgi:hypothetical protein